MGLRHADGKVTETGLREGLRLLSGRRKQLDPVRAVHAPSDRVDLLLERRVQGVDVVELVLELGGVHDRVRERRGARPSLLERVVDLRRVRPEIERELLDELDLRLRVAGEAVDRDDRTEPEAADDPEMPRKVGGASLDRLGQSNLVRLLEEREAQGLATLHVFLRAADRETPHPLDEAGPLGDADGASRLQHVERVRATQGVVVGGQNQAELQETEPFRFVLFEQPVQEGDVGRFEVVLRKLDLFLKTHVAVSDRSPPLEIEDVVDAVQKHADALAAVGDLDGDRRELHSTRLLEVGELTDLHPVHQDLPADAGGAERGGFPVVLIETDVVRLRLDAECGQRFEVELLHVGW